MRTDYFRNKLQHDNRTVRTVHKDMAETIAAFILARELLHKDNQHIAMTREQYAETLATFILQSTFNVKSKQA